MMNARGASERDGETRARVAAALATLAARLRRSAYESMIAPAPYLADVSRNVRKVGGTGHCANRASTAPAICLT